MEFPQKLHVYLWLMLTDPPPQSQLVLHHHSLIIIHSRLKDMIKINQTKQTKESVQREDQHFGS